MPEPTTEEIDTFIMRWEDSGGHERGAGHQFLLEFCELHDLEIAGDDLSGVTGQQDAAPPY